MKEAAALPRGGRHKAPLRPLPAMDLPFLVLVLTLVGFGLVMLGSASGAVALYRRGDAFAYLRPQLLYAAMGIAGLWLASRVDYHIFHKLAWPLLGVSLVLLVVVLFMPEYNGCKRWLVLPGVGTLQPSEIAKFAVVLVFSHIISLNHDRMRSFAVGVLPFVLVLGVVAALMLLEPHLSGTLLILGIGAVLMFVGGTGLRWFVLAGLGGAATRPSRACTPSVPAEPPGWGWGTAAKSICLCPNPRTTSSSPSSARNWALWGPAPWCCCSCCCSGGALPLPPMLPTVLGRCWWWALPCRWLCRLSSMWPWSPIPSPTPASACPFSPPEERA